ncbi:MAG: transcription antitermination factor NusB [Eubacterium sp.]|nr:transcription antitermination factor NusB [Eubacterium sp.]
MKKVMTRRTAREILVKIMYQADVNGDSDCSEYTARLENADDLKEYLDSCGGEDAKDIGAIGDQMDFIKAVTFAWDMHRAEVDEAIEKYSINWKLERMARTDLAILREAASEIMYVDEVPAAVTINEAVELAKIYGTEKSTKFINALLGKIAADAE